MTLKSLNIVQLNMSRSMAVADELYHHCITNDVDVALLQEPYTKQGVLLGLEHVSTRTVKSNVNEHHGVWAAIVVFNNKLDIIAKPQLTTTHTVALNVAFPGQTAVDLVSSYFQFRKPTEFFTREIISIYPSLSSQGYRCQCLLTSVV